MASSHILDIVSAEVPAMNYDFVHYKYFFEGSYDIIRVLGYNLLIRYRVQLYLYNGIKYN